MPGTPIPKSPTRVAFEALKEQLREAVKEVDLTFTQFVMFEENLDLDDWVKVEGHVHAVGDALRNLKTARHEAGLSPVAQVFRDFTEGVQVSQAEAVAAFKPLDSAHRAQVKGFLADQMREALIRGELDLATRIAELNKEVNEVSRVRR